MTKLNPDRVRRHMARSTPDRIERYFDTISPEWLDQQRIYQEWLKSFGRRMKIKHKGVTHIDIYLDYALARFPGEVLVVARQVPEERCGER